jgi:hypothetical protein
MSRCGHNSCPGLRIPTYKDCTTCGINLHSFCIAENNRKIGGVDSDAVDSIILCSVTCFHFRKMYGLTAKIIIKSELALLVQKNIEQLKKGARELNIKVNCQINGTS